MTALHYSKRTYKYRLARDYSRQTRVTGYSVSIGWVRLDEDGTIHLKEGYAWDGPSGPTIDTANWMAASVVHDGFYQLMREDILPQKCRKDADLTMLDHLKEDGMSWARRRWSYRAVRRFGGKHAQPKGLKIYVVEDGKRKK